MPPKASAKGRKPGTGDSKSNGKKDKDAEEAPVIPPSKESQELRSKLRSMKIEMDIERQQLNEFQQHKAKLEEYWKMEKQARDDKKLELRNKLQEKMDLEEKHNFELKIHKEKVKHFLYEQQTNMTDLKIDAETELKLQQDTHREEQHEYHHTLRQIQVRRKEIGLSHFDIIKNFKQEQEKNIVQLRQEFERKSEELKAQYRKKEKAVRKAHQEKRKVDVKKIEHRKDAHINDLIAKHKQKFEDIKNYYRDITHQNLDLIKSYREEVAEMKKKEISDQKDVADIYRINKKLCQPLQQNLSLVEDLKQQLKQYEKDKLSLLSTKHRVGVLDDQIKNLSWEFDILEQKYAQLVEERDELKDKLETTIFNVQQKAGFRNIILVSKVKAMQEDLEKTEAALSEVISHTTLSPEVVGSIKRSLRDVLEMKDAQIEDLREQVKALSEQYYDVIDAYNSQLEEYHVPLEEMGFIPAAVA